MVAYIRTLEQTIVVLKKGEDWAKENNVPESKMIKEISLTSDMKVTISLSHHLRSSR